MGAQSHAVGLRTRTTPMAGPCQSGEAQRALSPSTKDAQFVAAVHPAARKALPAARELIVKFLMEQATPCGTP